MLPVIYINLDRDLERRQAMEATLNHHGLPFERLPAVIWSALDDVSRARFYAPALNQRQFFRPLADGEKGCYVSHLRACEHLLASNAPALIVLEDDVELTAAFIDVVAAIEALPPDRWDLIKLYSRRDERPAATVPLTGMHQLVTYRRVPSMCNGYALSRAGAIKLLQHRRPFGRPVDVDVRYWWEADLRVLGVLPTVVNIGLSAEASSIWRDGRPDRRWPQRWRRWSLQFDYSLRNAWYRHRQVVPSGVVQPPLR